MKHIFLFIAFYFTAFYTLYSQSSGGFLIKPYLQFATHNSISILWETKNGCSSQVKYGKALMDAQEPNLELSHSSEGYRTMHTITLEKLEPETNYFWQVISIDQNGREYKSPVLTFKTAVKDNSAFMFALIGDTQRNNETPWAWEEISKKVNKERPNFVVHVGDLVDKGLKKSDWTDHFFLYGSELMERYPIYSVLGNHEQDSPLFYQYMHAPSPQYYYTFKYGNAQFFMLDSNRDIHESSEQYEWLEWELARSKSLWKFVVHHHPVYTSDNNDYGDTSIALSELGSKTRNLTHLYDRYGVDFCFYGHTHLYERTWPIKSSTIELNDGVIYLNSGGAGGYIEDFAPTRSWFTADLESVHHYCTFSIYNNQLIFKAIDYQGRIIDAFEMKKIRKTHLDTLPPPVQIKSTGVLFQSSTLVSLMALNVEMDIFYTLDGSDPTIKSFKYSSPFAISNSCSLKTIAVDKRGISKIKTVEFTKMLPQKGIGRKDKIQGLNYKYYEGKWKKVPLFDSLSPTKIGSMNLIQLSEISHGEDYFGIVIEGYFEVKDEGLKTFYLNTDDGSKMYINDTLVIDHDGTHSATAKYGQYILGLGLHKIRIEYFESSGSQHLTAGILDKHNNEIQFKSEELWRAQ